MSPEAAGLLLEKLEPVVETGPGSTNGWTISIDHQVDSTLIKSVKSKAEANQRRSVPFK